MRPHGRTDGGARCVERHKLFSSAARQMRSCVSLSGPFFFFFFRLPLPTPRVVYFRLTYQPAAAICSYITSACSRLKSWPGGVVKLVDGCSCQISRDSGKFDGKKKKQQRPSSAFRRCPVCVYGLRGWPALLVFTYKVWAAWPAVAVAFTCAHPICTDRMRTGKRNRHRRPDSPDPNPKSKRDDISINQMT
ncbi:hypothetical protein EVAR_61973_1 [Eumeta japonica]|uniref:Uncharacterized protein n=1 Tax=Eumeta variegata TaxID=151549 RepID=A0A4C1ZN49_EUMVA|nr:hypothetical protein EVAR_61973_1 [Eumeta japonica]